MKSIFDSRRLGMRMAIGGSLLAVTGIIAQAACNSLGCLEGCAEMSCLVNGATSYIKYIPATHANGHCTTQTILDGVPIDATANTEKLYSGGTVTRSCAADGSGSGPGSGSGGTLSSTLQGTSMSDCGTEG
jgi:hypothetical protein